MNNLKRRAWAEVDLTAYYENIKGVKEELLKNVSVIAVVKADGYGCGAIEIAKTAVAAGADYLAVAEICEGIELRQRLMDIPILVLGYTAPEDINLLIRYNLIQAIASYSHGILLCEKAKQAGVKLPCHLKLNSGMNRIGINCYDDTDKAAFEGAELYKNEFLDIQGIFTHFSSAYIQDAENIEYTKNQFLAFDRTIRKLTKIGIDVGLRHCCNSPGTINCPEYHLDAVRMGTAAYGIAPRRIFQRDKYFKNVVTFKTRIAQVYSLQKGSQIGYNRIFKAEADIIIAVISAGYADGVQKRLANVGRVIINDSYCNIVGNVCMDTAMVDVTHLKNPQPGDEVIILGSSEGCTITAADILDKAGIGFSEFLCGITKRVHRVYITD